MSQSSINALIAQLTHDIRVLEARKFGLIAGSIHGLGNVSKYSTNEEENAAYMNARDEARVIMKEEV